MTPVQDSDAGLDEQVYVWVRDRIIDGTFPAGSRIRERELADELGVSRIPIREAFPRLEAEGYIRSVRRRGVIVAPMEIEHVEELFAVRVSLEVLAARLAALRCAAGDTGEGLAAMLVEAERAVAGGQQAAIADATAALHEEIVRLSGNELLQQLMGPVAGRVQRLFHIVIERDEVRQHDEHRELCNAILNGEPELAAALALAHVEQGRFETMPIVRAKLGGKAHSESP